MGTSNSLMTISPIPYIIPLTKGQNIHLVAFFKTSLHHDGTKSTDSSSEYSDMSMEIFNFVYLNKTCSESKINPMFRFKLLEKAGLCQSDEINRKIQELSEGSAFFHNEQRKTEQNKAKLLLIQQKISSLTTKEIQKSEVEVDEQIKIMLKNYDVSRTIVHVDMDAFYASVEELDQPDLKLKPMAVGDKSMLSTSNYEARKYGVRAGMPGYIALKLCPELIIVPTHFQKYKKISLEIQEILSMYGELTIVGLDESYLDLTHQDAAFDLCMEIRQKILQKVKISASAGIACNRLLAKICSDVKKPNNQFQLDSNPETIMTFMRDLPIRKINGVGKVTEYMLNALGVETCGDFISKRGLFNLVLKKKTFDFLLNSSLGISKNHEYSSRKSTSSERTFSNSSDFEFLANTVKELCVEVVKDLQKQNLMGKLLTLKIKNSLFRVRQFSKQMRYTCLESDLENAALQSLTEARNEDSTPVRLLGVRVSDLISREKYEKQTIHRYIHCKPKQNQCFVCGKMLMMDSYSINEHLDKCLKPKQKSIFDYFNSHT